MNNIKSAVDAYIRKYPPAFELFQNLLEVGDVYMIGGVLREYRDKEKIEDLRDADFIIDIHDRSKWERIISIYRPGRNHFEGYKFSCSGFIVDVWEMEKTWALKNNIVTISGNDWLSTLPKTVFLNMDAIIYDMKHDRWYDREYRQAKDTGVLDVVLEDNPYVELNVLRAMILQKKYDMTYSRRLRDIIRKCLKKDVNLKQTLMDIQYNRYQKEILTEQDIEDILRYLAE